MNILKRHIIGTIFMGLCLCGGALVGYAQFVETDQVFEDEALATLEEEKKREEEDAVKPISVSVFTGIEDVYRRNIAIRPTEVTPADLQSLFYTKWQYALLAEAKRGFLSRPVESAELRGIENESTLEAPERSERVQGIREIFLSGISYVSSRKWTIWMNGQRMTPNAIPREVIDIKVTKEYIDLKWYDSYNNIVFPIRLRPHQRFNLDSRIFLPGTAP